MPRYLGHWELPQFVNLNNDILFGTVGMPSNYLYNTVDIDEAFCMAFSISNYYVGTFGSNTIAIFHMDGSQQWYVFDSHSRNNTGMTSPFGSSSFIEFGTYDTFLTFIHQNYQGSDFEITSIIFESKHNTVGEIESQTNTHTTQNYFQDEIMDIDKDLNNVCTCNTGHGETVQNTEVLHVNKKGEKSGQGKENKRNVNEKHIYININYLKGDEKKI